MDNMNPTDTPMETTSTPPVVPVTPSTDGGSNTGAQDPKQQMMGLVAKIEAWLDEYMVKKAPFQIPMGGKEFLATIAPYLVIIGVIFFVLSLPALLGLGMLGGAVGMMAGKLGWTYGVLVSTIASAISIVMEAMAISGLFKRTHKAWHLLFLASLVSFAGNILALNLIGGLIGGVIGWYILFQVKELYKN